MSRPAAVVLEDVTIQTDDVTRLSHVDATVEEGEFVAFLGAPGAGTDCLFHVLAGLQRPTSGRVIIDGVDVTGGRRESMEEVRQSALATIFESDNLLPALSVRENILLPARLAGKDVSAERFHDVTSEFAVAHQLDRHAEDLGPVDKFRVTLARITISGLSIIVCQDPTRSVHTAQSSEILSLLRTAVREHDMSVVLTTTDPFSATFAERVVLVSDGQVHGVIHDPTLQSILLGLEALGDQAP